MSTTEIRSLLDQLADAGVFFLTISGGEPLIRRDCFEIIEYARALRFNVKLKTNAVLIRAKEARRLRETERGTSPDQCLFSSPRSS
jgi:MoaA/NifB/PqqE/SkfB family radical SAM enzyme